MAQIKSQNRPAVALEHGQRAAISVSEMASLCLLSRSRFHALVRTGIFPRPKKGAAGKRPYYPHDMIAKCLEIRRTGIGDNGEIIVFNRRPARRAMKVAPANPPSSENAELVESLRSLGVTPNGGAVAAALTSLFPAGTEDVPAGEVVRRVFLHLQGRK